MKYLYFNDKMEYPKAVKIENIIYCSGITGFDPDTGEHLTGDFKLRLEQCFSNLNNLLKQLNRSLSDVVVLRVYLRNIRHIEQLNEQTAAYFKEGSMPVRTVMEVNRLFDDQDVELEAIVYDGPNLPVFNQLKGNYYSNSVELDNDLVFLSGEVSTKNSNNRSELTLESEITAAMDGINKAIVACGLDMKDLFSCYVSVSNMLDRATINEVYKKYFISDYPIRVFIEPRRLPDNKRIMIECIASRKNRELLSTTKGMKPTGPFSQGYKIGNHIYCSGVRAVNPVIGRLCKGDFNARVMQCIENLTRILEEGSASIEDVYSCKLYLRNLEQFQIVHNIFKKLFKSNLPVLTAIEICRLNEDYEKGWEPYHDIEVQFNAYKK